MADDRLRCWPALVQHWINVSCCQSDFMLAAPCGFPVDKLIIIFTISPHFTNLLSWLSCGYVVLLHALIKQLIFKIIIITKNVIFPYDKFFRWRTWYNYICLYICLQYTKGLWQRSRGGGLLSLTVLFCSTFSSSRSRTCHSWCWKKRSKYSKNNPFVILC